LREIRRRIVAEFVEVAGLDQVLPGSGNCFTVAGKDVALFNVDGVIYAIEDSCLHKGASLGTGQLDGKVVTCRLHGWRYDVTTGRTMNVPGYGVTSYPAKVIDGKILVAVA
jgi:nitrite reductase/ring-hydroxylating ferredoxin subunit